MLSASEWTRFNLCQGPVGPAGPTGPSPTVHYGTFVNTASQNVDVGATVPLTFDTTVIASGISYDVGNPSRITVTKTAKYRILVQLEFEVNTGTTTDPARVSSWLRINGSDVAASKKICYPMAVWQDDESHASAVIELIVSMTASQYIQVVSRAETNNVKTFVTDTTVPVNPCPVSPGIAVTIFELPT
jgi:hypothetical protein